MRNNFNIYLFAGVSVTALAAVFLAGVCTGPIPLSFSEVISILTGGDHDNGYIVTSLRLPRIGLAMISGAIITIGGFVMQALVRNPLADPYLMGLSSGAGLGANLYLLGIVTLGIQSIFAVPVFAFLGALVSLMLLLGLAAGSMSKDTVRLLLAGVALSSIFTALTGLLIFLTPGENQLRTALVWAMGSFNGAQLNEMWIALVLLGIYLTFSLLRAPQLDVMSMGDSRAQSLGLALGRTRMQWLIVSALCVGGVVAFTGPVGFVGMMIPHVCRAMLGHSHRSNLIVGAILGGAYLGFCDLLSQWLLPPAGLPVGLVTALFGVPFFIYLLMRKN